MVNLDERDLCVSAAFDKTDAGEIKGVLTLSPGSLRNATNSDGAAYLVELGRIMAVHNEKADRQASHHTLFTSAPVRMRQARFAKLGAGLVCRGTDTKSCRSRSFWFFKNVAPELAAKIIFENTVAEDPSIRACSSRPSA